MTTKHLWSLLPPLSLTLCLSLSGCDGGDEQLDRTGPSGADGGDGDARGSDAGDGDGDNQTGDGDGSNQDAGSDAATAVPCGGEPGLDPAQDCRVCLPGYQSVDAREDDLTAEGALAPRERPDCVKITTCEDLDCGAHGACREGARGASCVCEAGHAGASCESCAPLYESVAGSCVLGAGCAAQRCGGHGQCALGRAGEVVCQCDEGFTGDDQCGGPSVALAGPEEVLNPGSRNPLRLGLRNGAICNGEWEWTVEGGGEVKPGDDGSAVYLAPAATGELGRASVKAVCKTDARLSVKKTWPVAPELADAKPTIPVHGPCPDALAAEIDPVILDWMDAHGMAGGTVGVSIYGAPVCLRAYGYASLGKPEDGRRGVERMRTCTPLRLASVTKTFTRSALRAHLYKTVLPTSMGGGELGPKTPILPVVDTTMNLGNGNMPAFVEPASYYGPGWTAYLPDNHCVPGGAAMDPAWGLATFNGVLEHRAGFQPNQTYIMNTDNSCTNAPAGGCKDFAAIGDTMVSSGPATTIANDLGLPYGVPRIDDVMAWMGSMCMYDSEANADYRYSNFGYAVAGRAIELISGQTYEDFVLDYLEEDDLIDRDFKRAGRPIVYQGQNLAQGPRNFTLPSYMRESRYYTIRNPMTDVTKAVSSNGQWIFPETVAGPYGGANYDIMYAHGGLVANTLGLLNYARVYALSDGTRREKELLTVHDDNTRGSQSGSLIGTFTDLHQFNDNQPVNSPQGAGCYKRGKNATSLADLQVEPCPLPHGLTIAMLFNGDIVRSTNSKYVAGRHDMNVLKHGMRSALSKYSATVEPWLMSILPPDALSEGCEKKCSRNDPFCISIDCGDGDVDAGEACDDGNNDNGDGCQSNCTLPPAVTVPSVPPSYAKCEGRPAGECLGGPCGAREETYVDDSERLASSSIVHPDGDYSPHSQCRDDYTGGGESEQAVCRREIYGGKAWGVCRECGKDTMIGCLCPAPSAEDGGCNGVAEDGLSCVGGRCWKSTPPKWMCNVDCQDIYGNNGYCHHDSAKGAVCYDALCSEEVPTWCDAVEGRVCNSGPNSCKNGSCCVPECMVDADCETRGYEGFHCNAMERCVP